MGEDASAKTRADSIKFRDKYCRIYLGTASQGTDPLLESITDDVNAYRHRTIIVFEGLPLSEFGNQLPLVSVEVCKKATVTGGIVTPVKTYLNEVVEDILRLARIGPSAYNTSEIANIPITGFYLGESNKSYAAYLRDLCECFFVDPIESGGILKFQPAKRQNTSAIIPFEDMCTFTSGGRPKNFDERRKQDLELPNKVICKALNPALNYAEDTRSAVRLGNGNNAKQFSFSVVMTATQIATWAYKRLYLEWNERRSFDFKLPPKWLKLEAGDVVQISPHGEPLLVKIIRIDLGADLLMDVKTIAYAPSIYDFVARVLPIYTEQVKADGNLYKLKRRELNAILKVTNAAGTLQYSPGSDFTADLNTGIVTRNTSGVITSGQTLRITYDIDEVDGTGDKGEVDVAGESALRVLDIPLVNDKQDEGGVFVAVANTSGRWQPTTIYYSKNSTTNYVQGPTINSPSIIGVTETALPPWQNYETTDNTNSVRIKLDSGSLSSGSLAVSQYDWETALIGNEIVRFRDAVLNSDGTYTLSELQRGARGSNNRTGGHVVGEQFILLSKEITRLSGTIYDVGQTINFKAISGGVINQSLGDVTPVTITYTGADLKPYSPATITANRDGAGAITLTWKRRDRKRGDATAPYSNLPNSESLTRFEIDFLDTGNVVKRTVTVNNATTYVYSVANQTTDYGAVKPVGTLSLRIYQISGDVGRGSAGVDTV
ncbi:MAG: phage tail protein [Microcoleus sp.]